MQWRKLISQENIWWVKFQHLEIITKYSTFYLMFHHSVIFLLSSLRSPKPKRAERLMFVLVFRNLQSICVDLPQAMDSCVRRRLSHWSMLSLFVFLYLSHTSSRQVGARTLSCISDASMHDYNNDDDEESPHFHHRKLVRSCYLCVITLLRVDL